MRKPEPRPGRGSARTLADALAELGTRRWVGVPDSTLNAFIAEAEADGRFSISIATNECEAVATAAGHFLGSGQPSLVYLQNSGFGKTIHPITSLLCADVCRIPALLLVGWRGCPGIADEPQHSFMGKIMPELLRAIGVPSQALDENPEKMHQQVREAHEWMREKRTPAALLVEPGFFGKSALEAPVTSSSVKTRPTRREMIREAVLQLGAAVFVATTGKAARELYQVREDIASSHAQDFYGVGGMGCASSIALGIAQTRPAQRVCALDGDGAALMQLGTLATIGRAAPKNLIHVILDNHAHESTGGQPTVSGHMSLAAIGKASQYASVTETATLEEFRAALRAASNALGPHLIVAETALGSDPGLGRPTQSPFENVNEFLKSCP